MRKSPALLIVVMVAATVLCCPQTGSDGVAIGAGSRVPTEQVGSAAERTRSRDVQTISSTPTLERLRWRAGRVDGPDEQMLDMWGEGAIGADYGWNNRYGVELYINETKTDRHLHILAFEHIASELLRSDGFLLLDDCLNASCWAADYDIGWGWGVFVCGTYLAAGVPSVFFYLLTYQPSNDTWHAWDYEFEWHVGANDTWAVDCRADQDIDGDGVFEAVVTGFWGNGSKLDSFLSVWNITASGLAEEYTTTWAHVSDVQHLRATSLDVGDLTGDAIPDIVVTSDEVGGAILGRTDWFNGSDYRVDHSLWDNPRYTVVSGAPARLYDVCIDNPDGDSSNEAVVVGSLVGMMAVVVYSWTSPPAEEYYWFGLPGNATASEYHDVKIASDAGTWTSLEVACLGSSTSGGVERAVLHVWSYNGSHHSSVENWTTWPEGDVSSLQELFLTEDMYGAPDVLVWTTYSSADGTWYRNGTCLTTDLTESPAPEGDGADGGDEGGTSAGDDEPAGRAFRPPAEPEASKMSRLEYLWHWLDVNGWYILMSVLWGVLVWFIAIRLGALAIIKAGRPVVRVAVLAGLVLLTIAQWPGVPVWEFWASPRSWVWYRVTYLYDLVAWAIGSLLP